MTTARPQYVLGSDEQEIARLDAQAAFYEAATDLLLREAELPRGARVLDLGTGLGHVARLAAKHVGSGGEVVGIDADERLLRVALERTAAAELQNVRFERADVYDSVTPSRSTPLSAGCFCSTCPTQCASCVTTQTRLSRAAAS